MGTLIDTELALVEKATYEKYMGFVREAYGLGKDFHSAQVRYMMTFAHLARERGQSRNFLFIGGLGILGNLVNRLGEDAILKWRGTKDLDLVLSNKSCSPLVSTIFDLVDVHGPSLSIPNKLSTRGCSVDGEGYSLPTTTVDTYIPKGSSDDGVIVQGKVLTEASFERAIISDFFGIPIPFCDPVDLLEMKLGITTSTQDPRRRDCADVLHLVSLSQRMGYTPESIRQFLSPLKRESLRRVLALASDSSTGFSHDLIYPPCSQPYKKELTRL